MRKITIKFAYCISLAAQLMAPLPVQAGWLSGLLEGKLPPIEDVGLCIALPSACILNEAGKEVIRQQNLEKQKVELEKRLGEYQRSMADAIKGMEINSDKERAEIRAVLNQGDSCLLKAKNMKDADDCYINAQRDVLAIHRKYQDKG